MRALVGDPWPRRATPESCSCRSPVVIHPAPVATVIPYRAEAQPCRLEASPRFGTGGQPSWLSWPNQSPRPSSAPIQARAWGDLLGAQEDPGEGATHLLAHLLIADAGDHEVAARLAGCVIAGTGRSGRDLGPGSGVADAHGTSGDLPGADPAGAAGQPEAAASAQPLAGELDDEGAQAPGMEGQGGAEVEGPHAVVVGAAPGARGRGVDTAQGGGGVVSEGGQGLQEGCVEPREQEGVVGAQVLDEVGPGGVLVTS